MKSKDESLKKEYREVMFSVKLPDEFYPSLSEKLEKKANQKYSRHIPTPFVPVFICMFICMILFTNSNIILAVESAIKTGITYFKKDISNYWKIRRR